MTVRVDERPLRIGTRGSRLALWQAGHVAARFERAWAGRRAELITYQTLGDRIADVALTRIGDRGVFTRDIEAALRDGAIDVAVHSLKDLPTGTPAGLTIGAVLPREDPRDVLVSGSGVPLAGLPSGARVGTSSLRRRVQLLALRTDLEVIDIRGNVPTRLDKVARGEYEGTVLAYAGLRRLELDDRTAEVFDETAMLPAPGQGALAIQVRAADPSVRQMIAVLDDPPTRLATLAERAVLAALRGGCQAPLGTLARWESDVLRLSAVVGAIDGRTLVRAEAARRIGDEAAAQALGEDVARELRARGADVLLTQARDWIASTTPAGGTA